MKLRWWLLAICLTGCAQTESHASLGEAGRSDGGDEDVALADVPANVKDAALQAVPGLTLTSAERETEDGHVVFSLSGTADGKEYEVEVSPNGTVQEIESGGDDDHGGADDDDHGQDDGG